ncbi:1,4-alpha-glucan branching protein GlgB [Actinosynnema sp. NPDC091369]
MTTTLTDLLPTRDELDRLLVGDHDDPHRVLGAHPVPDLGTVVRTIQPGATAVWLLTGGVRHPMTAAGHGLFATAVADPVEVHRFEVHRPGSVDVVEDPYRRPPTIGAADLELIAAGRHERLWEVLGAHVHPDGVAFAVWAPNAAGVRVAGDFDSWSGRGTPMRSLGASGVWELFVPGVRPGCRYKFRVLAADGSWHEHADPLAFATEVPPANASVVTVPEHEWHDAEWLARRAGTDWRNAPMSVYEVHLGSWRRGLSYRELAEELTAYAVEMGFTHVEFLPVTEHPFGGSWGYQTTSYFAPTSRFGSPDDFRHLVDRLHAAGVGVILDWVPAHFPKDSWGLARFDGTALYEHADPRRGEHPDWGTYVFDVGRAEVRNFLVASALFWLSEMHVDGLRVDAVASMLYRDYSRRDGEWVPNAQGGREDFESVEFLRELTSAVHRSHPGAVVLAEESTTWPGVTAPVADGGLGFDFKWNMGWMHDTLEYLAHDPIDRAARHGVITFSAEYAWSERYLLPLSHDEVVHGKGSLWRRMPGDDRRRAAGLRGLLAYMWAHPGRKLLFMGGEFGQPPEWDADASLGWELLDGPGGAHHRGIQRLVADMNEHYRRDPALHAMDDSPEGFEWITADDAAHNVLAFLRLSGDGSVLACVANFAGVAHEDYPIGLPVAGRWREVLNSEAFRYGGTDGGNGVVTAGAGRWRDWPASAVLRLPALGVVWLTFDR